MDASDRVPDNGNQNKNVNLKHMFQNDNRSPKLSETFELDSQIAINLHKIAKSYRSFNEEENLEVKTNSLVSCANGLLEANTKNLTEQLYDYLDEMKSLYKIGKIDHKEEILDEEKIEEIVEEEIIEEPKMIKEVNIDEIFKTSEQELSSIGDQKSLLKTLIDDINVNSKSKYDDLKFEKNIKEIIKETKGETEKVASFDIMDEIEKMPVKKNKSSFILTMLMVILLGVAIYVNWDLINEFIKKFINNM